MKKIQIRTIELKCKFCGNDYEHSHRSYLANPFCSECLPKRLEASGAVDLRDNYTVIDHGNGFETIVPIDKTKLFKAEKE